MAVNRRIFTDEFKTEAVRLVTVEGHPARQAEDRALVAKIQAVHSESRRIYGSPRVHASLKAEDYQIGRNRVARLMRKNDIRARTKRKFRVTTDGCHDHPVAPNLLDRQFTVEAPNTVWLADLSYIWTREGWLYLAVVLDLFSRQVVGWAMDEPMPQELTLAALDMALKRRRPLPGLMHHSDRGVQGKFKRSSQHPDEGGCDEEAEAAFGSVRAGCSSIARPAPRGAA